MSVFDKVIKPQLDDVTIFKRSGRGHKLAFDDNPMYPLVYQNRDNEVFCYKCASKIYDDIESYFIFLEGEPLECNECQHDIESAYGNPNVEEECTSIA